MTSKILLAVAALAAATSAQAAFPVYAPIGMPSTTPNIFVSTGTGAVTAYFAGFDAGLDSRIGLSVNGGAPALFGLLNKTSAIGQSLVLGNVAVGDTLEFVLKIKGSGPFYSTTAADNAGGLNHAFSTAYAGGDFAVPAGVFVAFEDLPNLGDRDYNDHRFVFTFPGVAGVPEPATWAMLIAGFGMVGYAARRRKGLASVAA